jgi:sodium-independent sulfate anion transporter 11
MGLLTGEIVTGLIGEGYTAQAIASAAAFWVGIYSLILGLFRLGFLLDFIPLPVLSGYVSAAAITIVLQQLKELFGESKKGSSTAAVVREFFKQLPETNWRAFLVGISCIVLLLSLQFVGRKWGKKYRALWYLSVARNAIVLVLFTAISWGVNKSRRSDPLFGISKVKSTGIIPPKQLDSVLLLKVAGRSVAVFLAAALEHLAIGKAFGRRHGYVIEQDQELSYIGLVNMFGSFFSSMPVTGGFSRTAVNSESGVKSPLSGLATTACVLVSIYKLTDAFYWIPSATLSAIIIVAVWQIILPFHVFWHYWKTSFADFIGSMVAFWVTLFVDVEIGIAVAVGYSLVYVLLRLAFSGVTMVTTDNFSKLYQSQSNSKVAAVPDDAMLFMLQDSVLYPNAARITRQITDAIYTYSSGTDEVFSSAHSINETSASATERLWNDTKGRHIRALRKEAGTEHTEESPLPRLCAVIVDMARVAHVDATAMQAFADIRCILREWAGPDADLRFVGLNERVKDRFKRSDDYFQSLKSNESPRDEGYIVFDVLQTALYNSQRTDEDVHAKQ